MSDFTVEDLHGNILPVWTLDFETFYEASRQGYSLSNKEYPTTVYVRDPNTPT